MKKIALTAVSMLIAGSASAADLGARPVPYKAAPAPVAVGYNWTGCYVGGGGGYGLFDQKSQYFDGATPIGQSNDNGGRGWFGTVQVGCDFQFGSNFLIGAFGDYDFASIKGDMAVLNLESVGREKMKNSWAAGGRLGYLPFQSQQLLVYVSGGYTQARFDAVAFSDFDGGPNGLTLDKHTYSGWFLGSGYEYQFGWLPIQGLTWKTEYRFADYSADSVPVLFNGVGTGEYIESRKYVQTVRSSLVWRFNFGGSPVVARY